MTPGRPWPRPANRRQAGCAAWVRSSFRDWCAENGVSRDLAEAALAHAIKDKTEAAYNRTSMIEQRRAVMERWATFAYGNRDTRDAIEGNPISINGRSST